MTARVAYLLIQSKHLTYNSNHFFVPLLPNDKIRRGCFFSVAAGAANASAAFFCGGFFWAAAAGLALGGKLVERV